MKKYILLLLVCACGYSQEFSRELKIASKDRVFKQTDSLQTLMPDLSFYSKNYDNILAPYNYTFDNITRGKYVDFSNYNSMLYTIGNGTFPIMPMAGVNVDASLALPWNAGYLNVQEP